ARGAALFVFVAATIYLGWWTRPEFLSSRARLAAEALHKLGVQLNIVSWPYFNTDHLTDAQLRSISTASLFGGVVQDSDLALLKDLPGLVTVQFGGPNFSDACLVDLASVKSLKTLWATQTRITGQGFTNLRGLYNLETLYLDDSPIDDAGLTGIGVMRNLKIVHLDKTRITDAGLDALRSLDHCEELYLTETEVGDGVVQLVENMPSLRVIALYQTRVTGQGLDKVNRILAARRTTPIPLQPPATP
ncbi:MAG: hypothetical protein K8T25_06320, partial [Planctomycetia bacterium]|nr:hypothetical protein [Planctomycetia bacterium]